MATPTLKHGAHRLNLTMDALAAGSANDSSDLFLYDLNYSTYSVYDPTTEYLFRAGIVFAANVSVTATNFFNVVLSHYNSAGVLQDQVVLYNQSTTAATAYTPIDVTSNASAGGAQGRTLTQGWILVPGDTIELKRTSTGTGAASPSFAYVGVIGVPN